MRSQRGQVWAYLLLGVSLLGALSFGIFQTQQKNRLALDNENKYMSAFHKLKWTSENIEERTARLMATNDLRMQESLLADLRVFSAQAVEHMSVLPLLTTDTPRVEHFLNTLRERSDVMHDKINRGEKLSEEDWTQLLELRRQAVFFEGELANMLGLVGNGMIRWSDTVRVTGPNRDGDAATPITRSVAQMEKALTPPPGEEKALDPQQTGPMKRPYLDPGPRVDGAAAIAAVRRFADRPLKGDPVITGTADPDDKLKEFSLYFVSAQKDNGTPMTFGVSIHGGHVIFMIDGRQVTEKNLTLDQLKERAREMLAKRGYTALEFVSAAENDGTMVMDWAPIEKGVAVHVDRIRISLAMDNGELVSFDAKNYWINRHSREFQPPVISKAQARERVAPRLKVSGEPRLVLIADRRFHERLAWEVPGNMSDLQFRVYVSAENGEEIDVQRISGGDPANPLNIGLR
ncbi:MAG TPA: PepSY1/2 domain-containing protein [Symbiobacteriaceae bacterium]|nr:PepSY1/2 domain-containing protein [Symbiobacteriaceae bacterium]